VAKPSKSYSLDFFRRQLAGVNALPQLSILALLTGLLTGLVILLFNAAVDFVLAYWVLGTHSEDFESLSLFMRMLLPCAGGLVIGLTLMRMRARDTRVGVVHVMERLSRHQGQLPLRNAAVQFFAGIVALISGQAGGREGPAIHLGAASSSLIGQAFELPNNSVRTLVACGTAAAIAGSFNTPIAGVIFAMEVVMMEYTIASFIPVILAAVTSTFLTHSVLGNATAFNVPQLQLTTLSEIPFIILAGLMIGCLAAAFNTLVELFSKIRQWSFPMRGLVAGAICGICAFATPQVMGIGYDTVNGALLGNIAITTLLLLVLTKSIASAACLGFGLPLGIIGPTLFIGASFGGVLGLLGQSIAPSEVSSPGLYVMLGMSAMMGAVVQAPLAALMTVLELTANPNVILPAMLIIVVATLVCSEVFQKQSIFLTSLKNMGLEYPPSPVTLHLQRAAVASLMHRNFIRMPEKVTASEARAVLERKPLWIVVEENNNTAHCLLNPSDLAAWLDELAAEAALQEQREEEKKERRRARRKALQGLTDDAATTEPAAPDAESEPAPSQSDEQTALPTADPRASTTEPEAQQEAEAAAGVQEAASETIELLNIPGQREDVVNIDIRATLQEALEELNEQGVRALCIRRTSMPLVAPIMGVLTRDDINNYRSK